jgi:Arc/MetJ family transcription regulator
MYSMRTTLNLDGKLPAELMRVTEAKTKTDAIHQAITDLIRRRKLEKLKSLSGKVRLHLDWRKQEKPNCAARGD